MKREFKIYVTRNKEIRAAIIGVFEKKVGEKHMPDQDCHGSSDVWLKNSSTGIWVGGDIGEREELTLSQLEAMPDYTEPAKEMTLPEIIKELGYEVKIVK